MANKKIKIRYIKSHDYKASLSSGVHGGIAANGLINMNFFIDRAVIPTSEIIEINENGIPVSPPLPEQDGDIVREVQFGSLLDVNTAKVIIQWLEGKIKEHETQFKR